MLRSRNVDYASRGLQNPQSRATPFFFPRARVKIANAHKLMLTSMVGTVTVGTVQHVVIKYKAYEINFGPVNQCQNLPASRAR